MRRVSIELPDEVSGEAHPDMAVKLVPDHQPSFAAVKKNVELALGRPLTGKEHDRLRNATVTVAIPTSIHKCCSRTINRRLEPEDAIDLSGAALRDLTHLKDYGDYELSDTEKENLLNAQQEQLANIFLIEKTETKEEQKEQFERFLSRAEGFDDS